MVALWQCTLMQTLTPLCLKCCVLAVAMATENTTNMTLTLPIVVDDGGKTRVTTTPRATMLTLPRHRQQQRQHRHLRQQRERSVILWVIGLRQSWLGLMSTETPLSNRRLCGNVARNQHHQHQHPHLRPPPPPPPPPLRRQRRRRRRPRSLRRLTSFMSMSCLMSIDASKSRMHFFMRGVGMSSVLGARMSCIRLRAVRKTRFTSASRFSTRSARCTSWASLKSSSVRATGLPKSSMCVPTSTSLCSRPPFAASAASSRRTI
jgi:hypothetical protein